MLPVSIDYACILLHTLKKIKGLPMQGSPFVFRICFFLPVTVVPMALTVMTITIMAVMAIMVGIIMMVHHGPAVGRPAVHNYGCRCTIMWPRSCNSDYHPRAASRSSLCRCFHRCAGYHHQGQHYTQNYSLIHRFPVLFTYIQTPILIQGLKRAIFF